MTDTSKLQKELLRSAELLKDKLRESPSGQSWIKWSPTGRRDAGRHRPHGAASKNGPPVSHDKQMPMATPNFFQRNKVPYEQWTPEEIQHGQAVGAINQEGNYNLYAFHPVELAGGRRAYLHGWQGNYKISPSLRHVMDRKSAREQAEQYRQEMARRGLEPHPDLTDPFDPEFGDI